MSEDTIQIPDSLPNLAVFYERAIQKFFMSPLTRWSDRERQILAELVGKYAGTSAREYCNHVSMEFLENPVVTTILTDAETNNLPKFVCLLKWLAPDGISHQAPTLISEISKRFL